MLGDVPYDRDGISGFVTHECDGKFIARRRDALTPYQKAHQCRVVISAPTMRELIGLAMAERIKADMIRYVEQEFEAEHGHAPESPASRGTDEL